MEVTANRLRALPDTMRLQTLLAARNIRPIEMTFACNIRIDPQDIQRMHGLYIESTHERSFFTIASDSETQIEHRNMTITVLQEEVKRLRLILAASHGFVRQQLQLNAGDRDRKAAEMDKLKEEKMQLQKDLDQQLALNKSMAEIIKQKEHFYNYEIRRLSLKLQEFINMDYPAYSPPLSPNDVMNYELALPEDLLPQDLFSHSQETE